MLCYICGQPIKDGEMYMRNGQNYQHNDCARIQPPKVILTFSSFLNETNNEHIKNELLNKYVPAEAREQIVDEFNEHQAKLFSDITRNV